MVTTTSFVTRPPDAEFVLKSTSGPFGPYDTMLLLHRCLVADHLIKGSCDTQNGDWYYMAFIDAYPGGRVPVLAPMKFDTDEWPTVELVNGAWNVSYPYPNVSDPS